MAFSDIPIRVNGKGQTVFASWFNRIRSELIIAFGSGGYIAMEATQTVASAGELTFSTQSFKPGLRVVGDAGAITTSATPFGASHGFADGKEIILIGTDNTNTVTIPVSDVANGVAANGKIVLSRYKTVLLIWDANLQRFLRQE